MPKSAGRDLTPDDFKRLPWRSIGPALMSGRVACLAWEPGNPKCFYAGFATGGIWRTENRGTTFTPLFDKEITSSIGSLAVCDAPADWKGWDKDQKKKAKKEREKMGKGRILWAGTGEGNNRNSSSWGNGVYRSTDRGATWEHLGLAETHDIPSLAVDPRDPDVCYIAALGRLWGPNKERGVYKTTDGGKTWNAVLQIDENTGCTQVMVDPKNPDTVYAAMYNRLRTPWSYEGGGTKSGFHKSTDGGKTWKKITKGLPKSVGRIGFDLFPGDPSKIIATVESHEGGTSDIRDDRSRSGGVFRSEDGGATWERKSVRTPRGWYFSKIYFDPKNDQRIYNLGWYVEVSDDGGETFRGGFGEKMHVDMHAYIINPDDPDHMINGSDGGIYQTYDGGKNWKFHNQIAVGQFYNISLDDSDPYRVIGGLQDNGTWVGPSSTNKLADDHKDDTKTGIINSDWQHVLWGDGFHGDFDPTDKDVLYAEWQGGNITRINLRTGEKKRFTPTPAEGQPRMRFNWNSPMFVSKHDPKTLYLGGNHVIKLTQRGEKWEKISGDLTKNEVDKVVTIGSTAETYGTVVSLAESELKKGLLWAGTDDGLIHVTQNDGKKWADITPKTVNGRYISRIEASRHDEGTAYASVDGHRTADYDPCILMTTDMGKSWKDITGDLPEGRSVKVVREDRTNPQVLYCGTESAVFMTPNRGKTWIKINGDKLPTTPVDDIKQHPRTLDLVLGTHGRSIWILDDASMLGKLPADAAKEVLHLFPIADARPEQKIVLGGLWTDDIFRAENRPSGAIITYWVGEYEPEGVTVKILDENDVELASLSGGNAPGLNRVVWDCQAKENLRRNDNGEDPWGPIYVKPGSYKVKVSRGKSKAEGEVEVLAPRE